MPDTPAATTRMAPAAPTLDDTMLAMDVVDTLRHGDALVARELAGDERRDALRARLREVYATQGIAVPDHILDQGIAALEERRFVYAPTPPSFARSVATAWATRERWSRPAVLALLAVIGLGGGWWFGVHAPRERARIAEQQELRAGVPQALAAALARIRASNPEPAALDRAQRLAAEGNAAAAAGSLAEARARLAALEDLRTTLAQEYEVRIVSRPGTPSGVFRVPQGNPRARNFYLIVEAVDRAGQPVPVSVTSEEDGRTARVAQWGLHVPPAEFERVRQDKLRDGLIGQPVVGDKRAGALTPAWRIPVTGGAILQW